MAAVCAAFRAHPAVTDVQVQTDNAGRYVFMAVIDERLADPADVLRSLDSSPQMLLHPFPYTPVEASEVRRLFKPLR